MQPKIIESPGLILVGMDFFGDPCAMASPWSEENEIGKLWKRFIQFLDRKADTIKHKVDPSLGFEVHIEADETQSTGHREVFVGIEMSELEEVPLELVVKVLPPTKYAIFTFKGTEIISDWGKLIYQDWLPQSGFKSHHNYLRACLKSCKNLVLGVHFLYGRTNQEKTLSNRSNRRRMAENRTARSGV